MDRPRLLRLVGAVLVLTGGAVHLKLNLDDYSGNDSILRTFAANAGGSALVAAYLVLRDDIWGPLAGLAVSVGTLIGFTLVRVGDGLFGFQDQGFGAPYAAFTVGTEVAAILVMMALIVVIQAQRATTTSSPRS